MRFIYTFCFDIRLITNGDPKVRDRIDFNVESFKALHARLDRQLRSIMTGSKTGSWQRSNKAKATGQSLKTTGLWEQLDLAKECNNNAINDAGIIFGNFHVCLLNNYVQTRDYFDATASNWNTSTHSVPWRVSLYKDRQSNRRVGVF